MKLSDKLLYSLFILAAVTLAALNFCLMDWVWGIATVAVVLFWMWMLWRRCQKSQEQDSR